MVFPGLVLWLTVRNFDQLEKKGTQNKYGSVMLHIATNNNFTQIVS